MRRSRYAAAAVGIAGLLAGILTLMGASPAQALDVDPALAAKGGYTPVTPVRLMDTRVNYLQDGTTNVPCLSDAGVKLQVAGAGVRGSQNGTSATQSTWVPSGATAVALNVTAADATDFGWITVWPTGDKPETSSLNYLKAQAIPNMVVTKLAPDGSLMISGRGTSCPEGIVDVLGYFTGSPADAAGFTPLAPKRIMDTRKTGDGLAVGQIPILPTGCAGNNVVKQLDVTNVAGTPGSKVRAVALNVTAADATGFGWLTLFPKGTTQPAASNLNYAPGQAVPNMVIVKVPDAGGANDGIINIQAGPNNATGCPHVIVDIVGYWRSADGALGQGTFEPISPTRFYDTREASGAPCISSERKIQIADKLGIPAMDPLTDGSKPPIAVALNVTATDATAPSFATVWDQGTKPFTSNLNYPAGHVATPNMVISKLSDDGFVRIETPPKPGGGCPHIIVDVVGWFADPELTVTDPGTFAVTGPAASLAKTITVTNQSGKTAAVKADPTVSGTSSSQFVVSDNTCTTPLADGASCTFKITWTPVGTDSTTSDATAAFKVAAGNLDSVTVPLVGDFTAAPSS
jgi:hypothetical protein